MRSLFAHLFSSPPKATKTPRFTFQWHLNNDCNLRCRHCYQDDRSDRQMSFDRAIRVVDDLRELLSLLRRTRQQPNLKLRLTLTGGEPLLSPLLFPLLEQVSSTVPPDDVEFALLTNGTLVDADCARRLGRYQPVYVQVSLDGPEAIHDAVRGSGSFARAIDGLRHLRRAGLHTLIAFTAHPGNYRSFSDVARIGGELGVDRVWADRLIPCGRGKTLTNALMTPGQTDEFLGLMRRAKQQVERTFGCRTEVSLHRALQFIEGSGRPYRCSAGRHLLALLPDGTLLPCRRLPYELGSVSVRSIVDLYFHPFLEKLRAPVEATRGCEKCLYQNVCGGGLRCLAHAVYGDPFVADPGCPLAVFDQSPLTNINFNSTSKDTPHAAVS